MNRLLLFITVLVICFAAASTITTVFVVQGPTKVLLTTGLHTYQPISQGEVSIEIVPPITPTVPEG